MEYLQFHLENFTPLERSNKQIKIQNLLPTIICIIRLSSQSAYHFPIRVLITILLSLERLRHPHVTDDCFQSGDSFLRVPIVCDLQDRIQDRPVLTTHPHTSSLTLDTGDIRQLPCPHILPIFPRTVPCSEIYLTNPDTVTSTFLSPPMLSGDIRPGDRWNLLS